MVTIMALWEFGKGEVHLDVLKDCTFVISSYLLLAALRYAVGGRHIDVINTLKQIFRNIRYYSRINCEEFLKGVSTISNKLNNNGCYDA